jgi:hypothetical protein
MGMENESAMWLRIQPKDNMGVGRKIPSALMIRVRTLNGGVLSAHGCVFLIFQLKDQD